MSTRVVYCRHRDSEGCPIVGVQAIFSKAFYSESRQQSQNTRVDVNVAGKKVVRSSLFLINSTCYMLSLFLATSLSVMGDGEIANAVVITNLKVPTTYTLENTRNPEPLILDCEYEVDTKETGFVLKWLLNGVQIYQWIPEHKPFPLGSMKSRIDPAFSLSTDFHHRHRAISIIKPEWNMTGDYTCSVQTFQSSDRKSSYLQIIVPETDFQLTAKVDYAANDVIIVCSVQNVFPEPILTILLNNDQPVTAIRNIKRNSRHLYSGSVSVELPRNEIESPTPINCVLNLPGSNYTKRRETIFYDQGPTTTIESTDEEISSAISRLEGDGFRGHAVKLVSSLTFIASIYTLFAIS